MVWFACVDMSLGCPPGSPLGSLAAVSHARPRHCTASGRIRGQENAAVFPASTLPSTRATLFAEGKKNQNKTKRNKTQGQRMTALPSRGSNAVSAASSCILTQYLDDGSFSPMLLIQHCTAVVSQAPRRIPFTNRALCFVFGVSVALVRLEYRGNGDFDHRRTCPSNSGPVWTHFHSMSFSLLIH